MLGGQLKTAPVGASTPSRSLTQPTVDRRAEVHSTHKPQVSHAESEILDHIDGLTRAAQASPDDAADILTESLDAERVLAESRASTWLRWFTRLETVAKEMRR